MRVERGGGGEEGSRTRRHCLVRGAREQRGPGATIDQSCKYFRVQRVVGGGEEEAAFFMQILVLLFASRASRQPLVVVAVRAFVCVSS